MWLVIGNKNYSSWSLRAWLALAVPGIDFEEIRITLDTPEFEQRIGQYSPTRRVPVLVDGDIKVWDSLAIAEYAADKFPDAKLWPSDKAARAHARSVSAEMHSGFEFLRTNLPMNARAVNRRVDLDDATRADIARIAEIWQDCRRRYSANGPWLFGEFSIADAMYAPVVFRFNTYGIEIGTAGTEYMGHVLDEPKMSSWLDAAQRETEVIESDEVGRKG